MRQGLGSQTPIVVINMSDLFEGIPENLLLMDDFLRFSGTFGDQGTWVLFERVLLIEITVSSLKRNCRRTPFLFFGQRSGGRARGGRVAGDNSFTFYNLESPDRLFRVGPWAPYDGLDSFLLQVSDGLADEEEVVGQSL